jgi:NAD-dependent dihydropyrimidine dehydrogenase PreA subunit
MPKPQPNAIARAWQERELPAVDERLCTACGRCVEICPTECLAMETHLPWLPRPAECISCGACVFLCPAAALTLVHINDESIG